MIQLLRQIYREKVALGGAVVALLGSLTSAGLITKEVGGIILAVMGVLFILMRAVLTPAEEVVVQRKAGDRSAKAGPASPIPDGTPVVVRRL